MAKDTKFGTFAGVFTPSILTILGVIMYMRLPWVVGNAGLYVTVGIVLVAHVISVTTGLSISSIATDKRVGAGGPYYIVSRSLGLPIGGTLGIALFLGIAFSISLYVIGFSESFLSYWELGISPETGVPTLNAIRICGTATILLLTIVTLVSTSLAIKTQYLILGAIVLSLASIFLGSSPGEMTGPVLQPAANGAAIGTIFGIYFPAVTGFTAGVNMSGDLRDPNRSIPKGTMGAIAVGLLVYVSLAIFMAIKIPQERLMKDTTVLLDVALSPHLVLAGIWGATLSSALGSILGAPRIMQAVAGDRIAPRFLAKGHGPGNEPRNALLLAFAIGEAGILVAELDVIAAVVSMVFLATYGFLNFSCAIESWASPDFRPQFRIPKLVSIVGAITTVVIMIQIDIVSMLAAAAAMTGLFFYLKRRQLTLETGDTWESIWSSLVRSGLSRLGRTHMHQRNWRPNIMLFGVGPAEKDSSIEELAHALVGGGGVLTQFRLVEHEPKKDDAEPPPAAPGIFFRRVFTSNPMRTMAAICEHHGYPALPPNTVVMDWNLRRRDPDALPPLLRAIENRDLNVLWVAENRRRGLGEGERIDFWWRAGRGNLPLAIAIGRFLTATGRWRNATVRLLLVADEHTDTHGLPIATQRLLQASRLDARIQVVREGLHGQRFEDIVALESKNADLTVLGLAPIDVWSQERIDELLESLGTTVLYRASSAFSDIEVSLRPVARASLPSVGDVEAAEELRLPGPSDLASEAKRFDRVYAHLTRAFLEGAMAGMGAQTVELIRPLQNVIKKQFDLLELTVDAADNRRQRKAATRAERAILFHCHRLLQTYTAESLAKQQAAFEGQIEAFLAGCSTLQRGAPQTLRVQRMREDVRPLPDDTRHVAQFKRWKRVESVLLRRPPEYVIPVEPLTAFHVECCMASLMTHGVHRLQADQHQLAVEMGKVLSALRSGLIAFRGARDAGQTMAPYIAAERERAMQGLEQLEQLARDQVRDAARDLSVESRRVAQAYADDLERFDLGRRVKKDRKAGGRTDELRSELTSAVGVWSTNQRLLLEETGAELLVAGMQHRVSAITQRMRDTVVGQVRAGLIRRYSELVDKLSAFSASMDKATAPQLPAGELKETIDVRSVLDELIEDTNRSVVELPESITKLTDESVASLVRGEAQSVGVVELPLRRTVQFLVESQFLAGVQDALAKVPMAERRGISVAEEVMRLVSFQQSDLEADDLSDDARRDQLRPVIEDGITRIQAELTALETACETLRTSLNTHLASFVQSTDPMALATAAGSLEQQVRSREGRKAVSGLRHMEDRVATAASRAMVTVLYRKSMGVLAAKQLGSGTARTERVVGQVLRQVDAHVPNPTVLEALPFYYRQLFLGQTGINESFWVGRDRELTLAESAVDLFRRGTRGALVVTGEAGAGKSALCTMVANRFFDPMKVHRVLPPRGGSIQPLIFRVALERALQLTGDPHQVIQTLPRGSVVLIDDLELWWERSENGQAVLEEIAKLIEAHGSRCFFILGINTQSFVFINRFVGLAGLALSVIECGPVDAEAIKSMVMVRHRSTGRKLKLGRKTEDQLSEWRLARLFNSYFDYAQGNLAAALLGWIAHIEYVRDEEVMIRIPVAADPEMLDKLRPEWLALLQQLVLHKQATFARLERITHLEPMVLREQMSALMRMGLLVENRQGVVEINRYLQHFVIADLARRGHLA